MSKSRSRIFILSAHARSIVNVRYNLIKEITGCGYQVHVVVPAPVDEKAFSYLLMDDVVVHGISLQRASASPLKDLIYLLSLLSICIRYKPAAVFSYNIKPVLIMSLSQPVSRNETCHVDTGVSGFLEARRWRSTRYRCNGG